MVQQIKKTPAAQTHNLSLIPEAYIMGGERTSCQKFSSDLSASVVACVQTHTHAHITHTCTHTLINVIEFFN